MVLFLNDRQAPSVEAQPSVGLTSWRILELPWTEKRILMLSAEGVMRVTTAIVQLDLIARTATTSSGRIYEFQTPPETTPLIRAALVFNASRVGLIDGIDVSEDIWSYFVSYSQ